MLGRYHLVERRTHMYEARFGGYNFKNRITYYALCNTSHNHSCAIIANKLLEEPRGEVALLGENIYYQPIHIGGGCLITLYA